MNNKVKEYLSNLQTNYSIARSAQTVIKGETERYNNLVSIQQQIIDSKLSENERILNHTLSACLGEVVDELAKLWNVDKQVLVPRIYVRTTSNNFASENKFIEHVRRHQGSRGVYLEFCVDDKSKQADSNGRVRLSLKSPLNLNEPQADGKLLVDHTYTDKIEIGPKFYRYDLVIDDYKNINFKLPLGDLVTIENNKFAPNNGLCQAFINASERQSESSMDR